MSYNLYGSIEKHQKILKTYIKKQHITYDKHNPYDPFRQPNSSFDTTNIIPRKRFNFSGDQIKEEHIDYLHNPYKSEPTIPYFQKRIVPFVSYRENKGSTLNYRVMIDNLGWN